MKKTLYFIFISFMYLCTVLGQIPNTINYQGYLTDENDTPLNGSYSIQFAIYTYSSGGSALWSETHNSVSIADGIFNVILGSINSIQTSVFDGNDKYLGIMVGSDAEMTPRLEFTSVGYALRADNANDVEGREINPRSVSIISSGSELKGKVFVGDQENGRLDLYGQNNGNLAIISSSTGMANSGGIWLFDPSGNYLASMSPIINEPYQGGLWISNNGDTKAAMTVSTHGSGMFETWQSDGDGSINIGTWRTDVNSAATEAGWIGVNNTSGTEVITLLGNDGSVTANIKNFRMEHPNDPTKDIYYSSIEGPEVGAYIRGTSVLINGECTIVFPAHFGLVVSDEGITAQLTPRSASSLGLSIVSLTKSELRVKELYEGKGNYELDYLVQGVRKGYENFEVIRSRQPVSKDDTQNVKSRSRISSLPEINRPTNEK